MDFNKKYKNKITLNIILSLILIIGITYFVTIPASDDIKEIKNKTENLRIDLEKKYIKGQSLRKLSESLKKIESEISKLDDTFIKKDGALKFITSLEEIAEKTNIIQRISLVSDQAVKEKNYHKIPLHLFTTGKFLNQIKYLKELESSSYYINTNSVEISIASKNKIINDNNENDNINISILSNTYWLE